MKIPAFASIVALATAACHGNDSAPQAAGDDDQPPPIDAPVDTSSNPDMPALQFCAVADPTNVSAAYVAAADVEAVAFSCVTPCSDWTQCMVPAYDGKGQPILSIRDNSPIQVLAFVVDGQAGHVAFTTDGDDVVVSHAGDGGTTVFNVFDRVLQQGSTLKTVTLGWERGATTNGAFPSGAGWFTRKDHTPSTTRQQAGRPAAVLQWIKDNFAQGKKLGTVGSSMGTIATFGAHVWYGLDSIIDYQMLIGGPGYWDVNMGCGRVHTSAGFCDEDVSACTGNPNSSYGNNDTVCGNKATNNCRVPTVMAPAGSGSAYDNIINYVGNTTVCAPVSGADDRDASLDASSLATTVTSWSFRGPIDIVANEGGTQPPNADQGMGEGHMMYLYTAIQSQKSWTDNEGFHHGDAFNGVQSLMLAAGAKVIAGMGH